MAQAIVVGAGGISHPWFKSLLAEGVSIPAVVDLRKQAAEQRIEEHEVDGAVAYDDLDKALADHACDFVVDLTVPSAHADVTCKALEAGRHVIGEKPMAETFEQARRMVATAEQTGMMYMVSQSRRWNAGVLDVAEAVGNATLGRLTAIKCDFFLRSNFGGFRAAMDHVLLVDMAIHHFDLARKMGRVDPLRVYAEDFNTPDSWGRDGIAAHAVFRMTDQVRFSYAGSWCARGRHNSWDGDWRFQCTDGSLHYEHDQRATGYRSDGDGFTPEPTAVDVRAEQPDVRGQHAAIREMLRFLAHGTVPQSECHDNIKSFAMVCAAVESCQTGNPVDIAKMLG